ncbi:MAG: single-stranded DNA-binding protein [Desulfobacterales bacterium]|nr:single-stranded DNA-binding protein [Desulfobacterales bacterium]
MAGLNKVMLIGRLGKKPEISYSQQGLAVVNFSIATNEQWTNKITGERQDKTQWHNIVVFGKQAEICEKYLSKGSQIYIEGRLETNNYEKEGQTHYITKVIVSNFQFLDRKQNSQSTGDCQRDQPETANNFQDKASFQETHWKTSNDFKDEDVPF